MSGSSSITIKSDYFLLHSMTPSIHFVNTADESEFHTTWKKESEPVMKKAKESFEQYLQKHERTKGWIRYDSMLTPYYEHDTEQLDILRSKRQSCRIAFLLPIRINSAMTHIDLCFSEVPLNEQLKRLKNELIEVLKKDSLTTN